MIFFVNSNTLIAFNQFTRWMMI